MEEVDHASRAEHDIVVQLLAQSFPELERELEKRRSLSQQVVRPHDRRVAPCIAAPEPASLEYRDAGHSMIARKIITRSEAVPSAADDDRIIAGARSWFTPCGCPFVPSRCSRKEGEKRVIASPGRGIRMWISRHD